MQFWSNSKIAYLFDMFYVGKKYQINPQPMNIQWLGIFNVRLIGLEPTRPKPLDPKSSASTNFATSA